MTLWRLRLLVLVLACLPILGLVPFGVPGRALADAPGTGQLRHPSPCIDGGGSVTAGSESAKRALVVAPRALGPRWKLVYEDQFNSSGSGWPINEDETSRAGYLGGGYQILIKAAGWCHSVSPGVTVVDYAIEVDGRLASTSCGSYGIVFGVTAAWDRYVFRVDPDQYFSLYLLRNISDEWRWDSLVNWTQSWHINSGSASNRLRVERVGNDISLYVNGQHLRTISDASLRGDLRVGLIACSGCSEANVDVRFDDFEVWAPQYAFHVFLPAIIRARPTYWCDPYEPNDHYWDAYGPLILGQSYMAYLCANDSTDWYYFDLPVQDRISIDLGVPGVADYDLYLYTEGDWENWVARSANWGHGRDEHIGQDLPRGRYYVRVYPFSDYSNSQPYTLVVRRE